MISDSQTKKTSRLAVVTFAIAATVAMGCSGASSEGDVGVSSAALTSADKAAYDYFIARGLTSFQAAGIVGNLDQESNVDPSAVQPNGVGHGIAQWSKPGRWNTDGNDNVLWYAAAHGASAESLQLQLEFIWYELTTFPHFGLARLRATTNVTDATIAFENDYEECGHCEEGNRVQYAKNALAAFGHDHPTPPPGKPTPIPTEPSGCGEIQDGRGIAKGHSIRSCDDRFELVLQGDGNLVEYGPVLGAMWTSHTGGTDGFAAVVQTDGNFVLFGRASDALFQTHSNGNAGAVLKLQNDGNIVLYSKAGKALWSAGTELAGGVAKPTGCGEIAPGHGLVGGESVKSCDGKLTLAMQTDGNLVAYDGGHAIWSTGTSGKGGYKAQMQGDGNFVLYDWRNRPIWSTGTSGHPGAFLGVQGDGNLVVYAPGPHAIWASNTAR